MLDDHAAAPATAHTPEIMTIEQVADYLQLHPQVVYRHVRAGTLPASRIGRTIRFKRSVLDAFLERGAWVYANAFLNFVDAPRKPETAQAPPQPERNITKAPEAENPPSP